MKLLDCLAEFADLDNLPAEELLPIMAVGGAGESQKSIELFLRRLFVYAIVSRASDVHIEGRGSRDRPAIFVNVRTSKGFQKFHYEGQDSKHFMTKMFYLTGTPQGGSSAPFISTRFSMVLPEHYAVKKGLKCRQGRPYVVDTRVEFERLSEGFAFICRLLDQQYTPELDELQIPLALNRLIKRSAVLPSGLILTTGPTSSGKTTLLNAILRYLNNGQRAITTLENPVEYTLEGDGPIKQIPVDGAEITFARGLRSVLRADPDVILVGEIRDAETMEIALKAAQTGHIVLSTLHTNSSTETIGRLMELGADPFVLAEVLKLVMAQRLIHKSNGELVERALTGDEMAWLKFNGLGHLKTIKEPIGAIVGKTPIVEAFAVDAQVKAAIRKGASDNQKIYLSVRNQLVYEPLACGGLRAVEAGLTTIPECMASLEANPDAEADPCARIQMALAKACSLTEVNASIDAT